MNLFDLDVYVFDCLQKMKASDNFIDYATVNSVKELLSCIINKPSQLIDYSNEEKLSLVLTSIMTSDFSHEYPTYQGVNVRNLIFVCAFYLFMHQLEVGTFYDRNWPAFILLIHNGRKEFVNFIVDTNAFYGEQRAIEAAKGFELTIMLVAKRKGSFMEEEEMWYRELEPNERRLLGNEKDPFKKEAIPLYKSIAENFKEDNVQFVNINSGIYELD